MSLTKAQNAAIETSGKTILVSAAAGSGKTFTLTKRIIQKILNNENGKVDISRMLIVTFTRAAAQDLKAKISNALTEAIAENPANEHLQRQMLLLGDANISTIDSFFTEPVKNNFEKLGLPASLRLADSSELVDVKLEIMNNVIEEMYRENHLCSDGSLCDINARCDFLDFITSLSSSKTTSKAINRMLDIYAGLMSLPDGVKALSNNAKRLRSTADREFLETPEGEIIRNKAISIAELAACKFDYYIQKMSDDDFVREKYIGAFEDCKTACISLSQKCFGSYADMKAAFDSFSLSKLPPVSKDLATPFSNECKDAKGAIKDKICDFAKRYLSLSDADVKKQIALTANYNDILYKILSEFDRRYMSYKKEKGLCEFSDMPIYLLKLLEDETLSIREDMQNMYDEVYIDEYQDVNEIQDKIFKIIGGNRRFMVGDIKQSIYGFRDAVPELFASYRKQFPKHDDEEAKNSDGCTILMSENFRCDSTVIDFTNTVCPFLFEAAGKRLQYTADDDLRFSKIDLPEDYSPCKVQINVIEKSDSDSDYEDDDDMSEITAQDDLPKEAIIIAKEISRLLKEEKKPDGKPIEKKDIAILVRVKADGPVVAKALKKYGIDYCLSAKNEIFDGENMKALLDLMRVIDNPEDDISLCGFLTSRAYNGEAIFSLEEILTVRKYTPSSKSLMRALREYGGLAETGDPLATLLCHKAHETVKLLSALRAISRKVSVDKLLKEIRSYEEFSLICDTNAYIYLYDTACAYTKNSWYGLYSFLTHCKKLSEKSSASFTEATPADTVNIMTIHQSKGLERNTIFLYNASHKFSTEDAKHTLNHNSELCCATKLPHEAIDKEGNTYVDKYVNSIVRDAVILKNRENDIFEEMRVLYVALTRARERLYISATVKNTFEDFKNKILMTGFSTYAKLHHNNYFAWIILAILDPNNNVRNDSFEINVIKEEEIDSETTEKLSAKTNLSKKELSYAQIVKQAQESCDTCSAVNIPSKIAASKVSYDLFDKILSFSDSDVEMHKQAILEKLRLMKSPKENFSSMLQSKGKPEASEIGTATHTFLQFCDFALLKELGVESEIERLVENEFINPEVSALINKSQISKFAKSDFLSLILSCKNIRREFRFGLFCPASDFAENPELKNKLESNQVYVQGSIDILAEGNDGEIYICDYKTDRILYNENETVASFKARLKETHKNQLMQYKNAVKAIFNKAPDKIFIYSLPLGEAIELNI